MSARSESICWWSLFCLAKWRMARTRRDPSCRERGEGRSERGEEELEGGMYMKKSGKVEKKERKRGREKGKQKSVWERTEQG